MKTAMSILLAAWAVTGLAAEVYTKEEHDQKVQESLAPLKERAAKELKRFLTDVHKQAYSIEESRCGSAREGARGPARSYCAYKIKNDAHGWAFEVSTRTGLTSKTDPRNEQPTYTVRLPVFYETDRAVYQLRVVDPATCNFYKVACFYPATEFQPALHDLARRSLQQIPQVQN